MCFPDAAFCSARSRVPINVRVPERLAVGRVARFQDCMLAAGARGCTQQVFLRLRQYLGVLIAIMCAADVRSRPSWCELDSRGGNLAAVDLAGDAK